MKNNYFITYPFYAKTVELKIFFPGSSTAINIGMFNSPSKQFPFEYNEFLNMFILSIPPDTFLSGEYRCQFLIDGFVSCDGRFPNVEFDLQGELLGKKSEERMEEMKNLSFSQFNIDY